MEAYRLYHFCSFCDQQLARRELKRLYAMGQPLVLLASGEPHTS